MNSQAVVEADTMFLFEIGTLRHINRGWNQLSNNKFQNLTEHIYRTIWIAFLTGLSNDYDEPLLNILLTAMFYNIYKTRTGDQHYVASSHTKVDKEKAFKDILRNTSINTNVSPIIQRYINRNSQIAKLVYSANALENRLELAELSYDNSKLASIWAKANDQTIYPAIPNNEIKQLWSRVQDSNPHYWHLSAPNVFDFKFSNENTGSTPQKELSFLYEIGSMRRIDRTWTQFTGHIFNNLAEHIFRSLFIGYILSLNEHVDTEKVLSMLLLHDLHELRSIDVNYLMGKYIERDTEACVLASIEGLKDEDKLFALWKEFSAQKTIEAKIARDADKLEPIFELKEQSFHGTQVAKKWFTQNFKLLSDTLHSNYAKEILDSLHASTPNQWHLRDGVLRPR